tara:strand:- start:49 stop:723 length:675 start_codon:yes stop_codon:yes gene_type:complete
MFNVRMILYITVFLIIILIILYIRKFEDFTQNNRDEELCKDLYENDNNKEYTIIQNLLFPEECDNIIREAEDYATDNSGWTTERHDNYPTTDNEITSSWATYNIINSRIHKYIFPEIANMYYINSSKLEINELFVAKYSDNTQTKLDEHVDGSEFSFVIALNDNFSGGGTHFVHNNKTIKLNKGACLVFSGQSRHSGVKVTKGTRYILTGFLNYKSEGYCDGII